MSKDNWISIFVSVVIGLPCVLGIVDILSEEGKYKWEAATVRKVINYGDNGNSKTIARWNSDGYHAEFCGDRGDPGDVISMKRPDGSYSLFGWAGDERTFLTSPK